MNKTSETEYKDVQDSYQDTEPLAWALPPHWATGWQAAKKRHGRCRLQTQVQVRTNSKLISGIFFFFLPVPSYSAI